MAKQIMLVGKFERGTFMNTKLMVYCLLLTCCSNSKIDLELLGFYSAKGWRVSMFRWDPGAMGGVTISLACADSNEAPKWSSRFLIVNRSTDVKVVNFGDSLLVAISVADYSLINPHACGMPVRVQVVNSNMVWDRILSLPFQNASFTGKGPPFPQ